MNVTVGMAAEARITVTEADTAAALGSGTAPVLATPRMTALMEQAAWQAIAPGLDGGQSSVGVALSITHDAPTPVGMEVRARAEVTAVNGRKISFSVQAFDARGPIGQGVHDRVVIGEDKFVAKCYAKLEG
ncbi:MAG TPA: thioesterase family protein [Candidatus Onthomonas avicola]|nr:thioesterase family protein [Candidatus Onthomonas avicola]